MIGILILISVIWITIKLVKRKFNKSDIIFAVIALTALIFVFTPTGNSNKSTTTTSHAAKTELITKKQYSTAKDEHVALVAKDKKLAKVLKKTNDEKKKISSQESENKSEDQQVTNEYGAQDSGQSSTSNSKNSGNDMITGSDHRIVGNVRSHIYHVPGQRGYSMKSKNAVYFQTEQEAINDGYRKAKQ
jgi:hypothetical protein